MIREQVPEHQSNKDKRRGFVPAIFQQYCHVISGKHELGDYSLTDDLCRPYVVREAYSWENVFHFGKEQLQYALEAIFIIRLS